MYYNHDPEKGVIGRWENLRFENGWLVHRKALLYKAIEKTTADT